MPFLTIEYLSAVSELIALLIGFGGIFLIAVGCFKGTYLFIKKFSHTGMLLADIRMEVGQHLALGLEFLVGKDIIESVVQPTWDELGKLAVIILLRTLLTLFLGWEMKGVREEAAEEQESHQRECAR